MKRWIAVALVTCFCIANSRQSQAGTIQITGSNQTPIYGSVDGQPLANYLTGGEMTAFYAPGQHLIADYCLNAQTDIAGGVNQDIITSDGTVNGLSVQHADAIAWLISNVGIPLHNSGDFEAQAGLQAAIWNLAGLNGLNATAGTFDLDLLQNTPGVIAAYQADLLLAQTHTAPVNSVLWISVPNPLDPSQPFQAQVAANPVPEPSSMCLAGFGLLALAGYRRVRSQKSVV